ncbi:stage II sporulation protein R [Terrilactibacillus sp. S3-3]|nr:stage II sporulation protein R [Terrilactibacillus sp. S3-3]
MKKHTVIIVIISMILFITLMQVQQNLSKASADKGAIPKDAIRLRILANSNSAADQMVKRQIRDAVNEDIEGWVHDLKTSRQAKMVIRSHIGEIRHTVRKNYEPCICRNPLR